MTINELNVNNRFRHINMSQSSKSTVLRKDPKSVYEYPDRANIKFNNNNIHPLYSGTKKQPSFKGGFFGYEQVKVSKSLRDCFTELTKQLGSQYSETYGKYVNDFLKEVKHNEEFRKIYHISDESYKAVQNGEWIGVPQKGIALRFLNELSRPVRWANKKTYDKEKIARLERYEKTVKNAGRVQEFWDGIIKRDLAYKNKFSIKNNDEILIPIETLKEKIIRKRSNNIKNENYSLKALNAGNRITSGAVAAVFLGIDAFNTTMYLTKSEYESKKEGITRFMQEAGRLAITVYANDLIVGTFKKESDRSMKVALATAAAGVLIAEITGRWLVGKPILPSSKERIEKLDQKAKNRTGISAAVGNILSGEFLIKKKPEKVAVANNSVVLPSSEKVTEKQDKVDNNTSVNKLAVPAAVAFTGKFNQIVTGTETATLFTKAKHINNEVAIFEKIDNDYANWLKKNIISCLQKNKVFEKPDIKESLEKIGIKNAKSNELVHRFKDVITVFGNQDIPIGTKEHKVHRWLRSFFSPIYWIYDGFKWIRKNVKKLLTRKMSIQEKLQETEKILEKKGLLNQFEEMMNHPRTATVRDKSSLSKDEIRLRLMEEYLEVKGGKLDENIKGVRNSVSWLENVISKFKDNNGNKLNLTPEQFLAGLNQGKYSKELESIKKDLFKNFEKVDGKPELGYKKSEYAVWNYPVTKGLSTAFIVSDIYNLSMLHSDGDKDISRENAKNRAKQEFSRILWSQYTIGLTQNGIFKSAYDKSLKVAMSTVALNGVMRETLSRMVVNVPITPKSYDELVENKKKSQEASGPIKSKMAKIMGKKKNIYGNSASQAENATSSKDKTKSEFTTSA